MSIKAAYNFENFFVLCSFSFSSRQPLTGVFRKKTEALRQKQELRATVSIVLIIILYLGLHSLQLYIVARKWQLLLQHECPTRSVARPFSVLTRILVAGNLSDVSPVSLATEPLSQKKKRVAFNLCLALYILSEIGSSGVDPSTLVSRLRDLRSQLKYVFFTMKSLNFDEC